MYKEIAVEAVQSKKSRLYPDRKIEWTNPPEVRSGPITFDAGRPHSNIIFAFHSSLHWVNLPSRPMPTFFHSLDFRVKQFEKKTLFL